MEYVESRRTAIRERLSEVVAAVEPAELAGEMEHVTLAGGKLVRPTLTVLVCEAAGGDPDDAIDYAVGIELVHNASLVVDDIIDRSEVRRSKSSAWAKYGHGQAIVASDGMLGEAFELFSADARAMEVVADAMVELGEGEAMELVDQPSDEAEYMDLARRKTGALFCAAAKLGAIAADADDDAIEAFGDYAERVGIAFQIRDDVLDAIAEADDLGKPTGHDAEMDRPSIIQVTEMTPEEGDRLAHDLAEEAMEALARVELADSEARTYLEELATFVVERQR
ncbi:polyprenyl synthetase family protein [Halobacteriaceae archaeon GCM10025711]